jgi:predicted flap endonuclease-1-like 5' DNA nuclease
MNQSLMNHAEEAETRVEVLMKSLEDNQQETASLQKRMSAMQDDFTYILGIGPKVSSILRQAGINTFMKLASTNENRIREILEAENPSLLRLTNPSTWSEQARMASEEDWEGLSAFQNSLKGINHTDIPQLLQAIN